MSKNTLNTNKSTRRPGCQCGETCTAAAHAHAPRAADARAAQLAAAARAAPATRAERTVCRALPLWSDFADHAAGATIRSVETFAYS